MTAVNVILRSDAVYVITDGEVRQGPQGGELTPRPKLLPLPHLNAVLALRGWPVMLGSLYTIVAHRRHCFDDAAEELGADLRDAWEPLLPAMPLEQQSWPQEAILIGWPDDGSRPRCAIACSQARYGKQPYGVTWFDCLVAPDDGTLMDGLGRERLLDLAAPFDPECEGMALIDAQRRIPSNMVGGFAQLTTIRRDSIETQILKRWDVE